MTETAEHAKPERRRKPEPALDTLAATLAGPSPLYPQGPSALGTSWPEGSGPEEGIGREPKALDPARFPKRTPSRAPYRADGVHVRDAEGRTVCMCLFTGAALETQFAYAEDVAAALNFRAFHAGEIA